MPPIPYDFNSRLVRRIYGTFCSDDHLGYPAAQQVFVLAVKLGLFDLNDLGPVSLAQLYLSADADSAFRVMINARLEEQFPLWQAILQRQQRDFTLELHQRLLSTQPVNLNDLFAIKRRGSPDQRYWILLMLKNHLKDRVHEFAMRYFMLGRSDLTDSKQGYALHLECGFANVFNRFDLFDPDREASAPGFEECLFREYVSRGRQFNPPKQWPTPTPDWSSDADFSIEERRFLDTSFELDAEARLWLFLSFYAELSYTQIRGIARILGQEFHSIGEGRKYLCEIWCRVLTSMSSL